MKSYYFSGKTFNINNYSHQKAFANFLPGVAGKKGIPLWAFYVNRGQGIAGYGLQDKGHPIMTFTPANKAYEAVSTVGFRTFYKVDGTYYEAFKADTSHTHSMAIDKASFSILETNEDLGIETKVTYFGLPNMPLAGLVRKVEIKNVSKKELTLEVLDGIAEILPSGIHNDGFKSTSNLLASWMDVNHLSEDLAFYKMRASTNDSSEVNDVVDGNFYIGFTEKGLIRPIVDQTLVFDYNLAKTTPVGFLNHSLDYMQKQPQVTANKIPCGFIPLEQSLKADETITLYAVSGYTQDINTLRKHLKDLSSFEAIKQKEVEAEAVVESLLKDVETDTAHGPFNEYVKQNYLDNFLRGGYPEKIGDSIYHLYSRRHGDLERDYNFFSLAPEYYSQGGGNFRDVCQNRRMDTFVHKEVEHFNIHHFASLIQLDGYNPLTVNGTLYKIEDETLCDELIRKHFGESKSIKALLTSAFTPGKLVNTVERNNVNVLTSETEYLNAIIEQATPEINAAFGEGYWSDHFTYVLDLVESYESIYPDKMEHLLFEDGRYAYFDSPVTVLKQHEKTVIKENGDVRQYGSLLHFDKEKLKRLNMNPYIANWSKLGNETYHTTLFNKLVNLAMNKHSLLDPDGYGIEMEANKPGWNDAMNGVPGLHGSGVGETIEVLRIVEFLLKYPHKGTLTLPVEILEFFKSLETMPHYFDRVQARERYRDSIRFGLSGEVSHCQYKEIFTYLEALKALLSDNLMTLFKESNNVLPTFLTYEVTAYEALEKNGESIIGNYGLPLARPTAFKRRALPNFLEAPARLLKTDFDQTALKTMHETITASDIYDEKLKMYKTSGCLEGEGHEIGRIRAFTKGWLERESNFLHMNYKYLLGLLKAGLYKEYYEAIKTNLVCFMDPAVYGRNTLENSSFIAPSNNPNPAIHGQGFFARLSGSTVETINMWAIMMTGGQPFKLIDGVLTLTFEPKLDASFFKEDKTLSFTFLKDIKVTYIASSVKHTYEDSKVEKIELIGEKATEVHEGSRLTGNTALAVRDGSFKAIKIYLY